MKAMIRINAAAACALYLVNTEVYELHDDGSESLVTNYYNILPTRQYGIEGEVFGEPYEES